MGYRTDGTAHRQALETEYGLIKYKDQLETIYNKKIDRITSNEDDPTVGGTNNKADNKICFIDGTYKFISLKTTKGFKGSFCYINTTKFDRNKSCPKALAIYNKYNNSNLLDSLNEYDSLGKTVASEINDFNDDLLKNIITEKIINPYKNLDLLILDNENGIIVKRTPGFFNKLGKVSLAKISSKSYWSTKILIDNKDCGLIFRLHLNNGRRYWIKSGKSSSLVVKIEQHKILNNLINEKTNISNDSQ